MNHILLIMHYNKVQLSLNQYPYPRSTVNQNCDQFPSSTYLSCIS